MKTLALIPMIAGAVLAGAQTPTADPTGGYGPTSEYNTHYNVHDTFTFNGKVIAQIVNPPMKGMANGVSLSVVQPDKTFFEVQLGPEWYVSQMPIKIKPGDNVFVTGSRGTLGGKKIVFAQSIIKGKQQVNFRTKDGWGRWNAMVANAPAPANPDYSGTLVDQNTVVYDGVPYNVYTLNTGAGTVQIVGAPTWYSQRQPTYLDIGHNVQILGARRMISVGNNVFVADSIYSAGTVYLTNPW